MLMLGTGRERNAEHFAALFEKAGFKFEKEIESNGYFGLIIATPSTEN